MKSEDIKKQLQELLANFEQELKSESLRKKSSFSCPLFSPFT